MQLPTEQELVNWTDIKTPIGQLFCAGIYMDREGKGWGLEHFRKLDFYSFCLILEGSGRYIDDQGYDQRLKTGDCIWATPLTNHKYGCETGDTWSEVYLCFRGEAFDNWCETGPLGNVPVRHLKDLSIWAPRWLSILRSRPRNQAEAISVLTQIHLLLNDVSSVEEHDWTFEERLEGSKQHLISWPSNQQPDWELLASECSCSYDTWRKAFRNAYNISPAKFRRKKLMEQAAQLMTRTALSNDQLAEQFGCSDAFHFSKLFKSVMGVSPREYHQRLR